MQLKRKSSKAHDGGRKRARDMTTDTMDDNDTPRLDLQLDMPSSLKGILIEDWENITKEGLLVNLPAKTTVSDILDQYYHSQHKGNDDRLNQTIQGIKLYFRHLLGNMLLYRSEREQYIDLLRSNKNVVDIYGAEHLLRLFVELSAIMMEAKLDTDTLEQLQITFMDILTFLHNNEKDYFAKDYKVNRNR
ncbi:MRG domain-containing protein [Chlamydoabsidia padenii]|nr:MRG domain-containing protein [Chlamydoabsidia padenii]